MWIKNRPWNKDPYWTNQDSMEDDKGFFSTAQHAEKSQELHSAMAPRRREECLKETLVSVKGDGIILGVCPSPTL